MTHLTSLVIMTFKAVMATVRCLITLFMIFIVGLCYM